MSTPRARAATTAPSWWTWKPAVPSICCPTGRRPAWPTGWHNVPPSRSSAETGHRSSRRAHPPERRGPRHPQRPHRRSHGRPSVRGRPRRHVPVSHQGSTPQRHHPTQLDHRPRHRPRTITRTRHPRRLTTRTARPTTDQPRTRGPAIDRPAPRRERGAPTTPQATAGGAGRYREGAARTKAGATPNRTRRGAAVPRRRSGSRADREVGEVPACRVRAWFWA